MATLHIRAAVTGITFGIPEDEGSLITSKVNISRKIKKKDLRGKQGGYAAIASYGATIEATIEGAMPTTGGPGFTLAGTHSLDAANDVFSLATTLYVESINLSERNEEFYTASVRLIGSESIG